MVKSLDWLPKSFYVFLIIMGVVISFAAGIIIDWERLTGIQIYWTHGIFKGSGDTEYKVSHVIEYISGDLVILPFVIATKRWLNDNKVGYYVCCFMFDCLVIDMICLLITNPHEYSLSKWNMYGLSFLIMSVKFIIDGRFNKYSIAKWISRK